MTTLAPPDVESPSSTADYGVDIGWEAQLGSLLSYAIGVQEHPFESGQVEAAQPPVEMGPEPCSACVRAPFLAARQALGWTAGGYLLSGLAVIGTLDAPDDDEGLLECVMALIQLAVWWRCPRALGASVYASALAFALVQFVVAIAWPSSLFAILPVRALVAIFLRRALGCAREIGRYRA